MCGICRVKIESGSIESKPTKVILEEEFVRGIRQACQSIVISDLVVSVFNDLMLEKSVQARALFLPHSHEKAFPSVCEKLYLNTSKSLGSY